MATDFTNAKFLKSIRLAKHAPQEVRPSVVFAGKSNVGKSSVINSLVRKKGLAKTSSTPGRTQEIIIFDIDEKYYFIDLPGYGYAKAPKKVQAQWGPMIEKFLTSAEGLRLVVIILDVRREPDAQVKQLVAWLEEIGLPYFFVVNKVDKLSKTKMKQQIELIRASLGVDAPEAFLPFSATKGTGRKEMLSVIESTLSAPRPSKTTEPEVAEAPEVSADEEGAPAESPMTERPDAERRDG